MFIQLVIKTFCHDLQNKNSHGEAAQSLNIHLYSGHLMLGVNFLKIKNFSFLAVLSAGRKWWLVGAISRHLINSVEEYWAFYACPSDFASLSLLAAQFWQSDIIRVVAAISPCFSRQGALAFVLVGHSHHRAWRTDPGNKFLLLHKG